MATAYNSGYTVAASADTTGSASNGYKAEIWAEYYIGSPDHTNHTVPLTVYFYAKTKPGYTTGSSYTGSGLGSSCSVYGTAGWGVDAATTGYDFRTDSVYNYLGSWSGNIIFYSNGTVAVPFYCTFTTKSSGVSGGTISGNIYVSYYYTYTVEYYGYGASDLGNVPAPQTKEYGIDLQLSTNVPTKATDDSGTYTFVRWDTNPQDTGTDYLPGQVYSLNQSVILYPMFSLTEHPKGDVYVKVNGSWISAAEIKVNNSYEIIECPNAGTNENDDGWITFQIPCDGNSKEVVCIFFYSVIDHWEIGCKFYNMIKITPISDTECNACGWEGDSSEFFFNDESPYEYRVNNSSSKIIFDCFMDCYYVLVDYASINSDYSKAYAIVKNKEVG